MDVPSFLEPQMNVRVCRSVEESAVQPKFTFVVGDEAVGDFSLTRRCLYVLRFCIERDGCSCVQFMSQRSDEFWESMASVSRERFWIRDAPPTSSLFSPTFEIPECDSELCIETLGLMMLDIMPGQSFLHIHSGTGYACTIAASLLGPHGSIHGIEFRPEQRAKAKENLERLLRMDPRIDRDISLPAYHARFPGDLLSGSAKFDHILVTECFRTLKEVLSLRDMLNPDGVMVTGFAGEINDEEFEGVITVTNRKQRNRRLGRADDHCFAIHPVADGALNKCVHRMLRAPNRTLERLREARTNPADQPSHSSVPSLRTLALRACCKRSDPIGPLRGGARFVMRPPARLHLLPNLSVHLAHVTAAFHSFRTECLSREENCRNISGQLVALNELVGVTIALEGLGKEFLGPQNFQLWKSGEAVQLSVPQGVMAWLLENIFHVMHFSGSQYFEERVDKAAVMPSLLIAFRRHFLDFDLQGLDQLPPWNFQLCPQRQMRRTLTILAARFLTDVSCLMRIARTIQTLCEAAFGQPLLVTLCNFNHFYYESTLASLSVKMQQQSDSFTSLEAVQDCFKPLIPHVLCIYTDAHFLVHVVPGITEVQQLFGCFRIVCSSALRNLVASGRPQGTTNAAQQHFVTSEGGLLDAALFRAERESLSTGAQQDAISIEEASDFLVRRFMFDFKEVLWMAQSGDKERHLAMLEDNARLYYFSVLDPLLPVPYIASLLRTME